MRLEALLWLDKKGREMSKLIDLSVNEFSVVLASDAPAPGGGSTAALEGALGAALIGMVASLSVGRKKNAEFEPKMVDALKRAEVLREKMLDIVDRDTEAYNLAYAVFSMPKDTEEQTAARRAAMQTALKTCTLTPFELIDCALKTLELASEMVGKYNMNAISDLGVAVLSLKAAAQGAWLNMLINLDGIHDEGFNAEYRRSGSEIVVKAAELADGIYADILKSLIPEEQ